MGRIGGEEHTSESDSDPFGRSDLHHFAWDFTREVNKPRSIILVVLWSIWRPLGGRPNYLGFQASRGAHHFLEEARSMSLRGSWRFEHFWVVLAVTDLLFGIFIGAFGHLWQQGRIVEAIQCSSRAWHLPAWGLTLHTAQIFLVLVFMVYSTFGGL
jgi:hypothetical protein